MRVRAILKLRNDAMISARERLGLSQTELATATGVYRTFISGLESMTAKPTEAVRDHALKIAIFLNISPDDIMPDDYTPLVSSKHERVIEMTPLQLSTIDQDYVASLPAPDPESETVHFDMDKFILDVLPKSLRRLTDRQQRVIEMRYGINGNQKSTLVEVGKRLGISRERVRQIELTALRKLRRNRRIREFSEDSQ